MKNTHGIAITLISLFLVTQLLTSCVPMLAGAAATGVSVATDRRTAGTVLDDKTLEVKIEKRVIDEIGKDNIHLNVTSYKKIILLTGEVKNDAYKARAEAIIQEKFPDIKKVVNELVVGLASSIGTRTNDSFITSKIKANFANSSQLGINAVKVVTENGVVFLMGDVTQEEAKISTEIAQRTAGVKKIVKIFDYRN